MTIPDPAQMVPAADILALACEWHDNALKWPYARWADQNVEHANRLRALVNAADPPRDEPVIDVETAFQRWAMEGTPEGTVLPDDAFDWFEAGARFATTAIREVIAQEIEAIPYSPELEHGDNGEWMQTEAARVARGGTP